MANTTGAQPIGGGSRLLGVNQLQTSIDSLTQAVQNLTSKMGGSSGPIGSGTSFSNAPTLNQVSAGGNAGSPTLAGMPMGVSGGPPTMNQTAAGGNGGWGARVAGAAGAIAGSNIGSGMASAQSFGSGQLGTMSAISAYLQQGSLFGGNPSWLMNSAGFGVTLNDIANSPMDAATGQALINYAAGSWAGPNNLSRGITGAANMAGFLNPTLGYTGAAQLGQQLYSQQMSMNMMMMGYGLTPRTMRGGTNNIAAVNQAILQRTFGKSKVNQSSFNASAAIGGRLNYNLQGLGLSGQDLTSDLAMLSAQNKLANKGYSDSRIQSIFNGAATGNKSALAALQGAGINTNSILQTLKNKTAISTQRSGEEESGYQSGLSTSVGLLNKFNEALNKVLQGPLGKFIGYTGGFGASGVLGAGKDFMSGNFLGGLTSLVGGGAAATGTTTSGTTSAATSKVNSAISGAAKAAVSAAESQLGVPYVWGAEQPGIGFDCSGLTQWSYKRAGVNLPRTSQQQWSALSKNHAVGLNAVREGDLVFTAGSDGTFDAPGHVALMISNNKLIQAEETGTDIMITPYSPGQWDHAARPTGPGTAGMGSGGASGPASGIAMASGGGSYSEGGAMGSTNEIDAIGGAGGAYMSGFLGNTGFGSSGTSGSSASAAPSNPTGNVALGKQLAAKRGWTGVQWNDLYALWNRESGWSNTARNSTSGAYGIAQALGHGPSNQYPAGQYLSANQPPTGSSNAKEQILWGLSYIASSYGNPAKAWSHEQSSGWYARGTNNANRGISIVGENGPEAVVTRGGEQVLTAGQTAGLLAQIQSGQGRTLVNNGGPLVNLNLASGAIQVSGVGAGSDVSSSAREIASQIGTYLAQEDIIQKLAAGVSS